MAYQQRLVDPKLFDETFDILYLAIMAVVGGGLPFAVAVTALIERESMVLLSEHQADHVPGVRVQAASMQKENRRTPLRAPIEVMKAHPLNDYMMRVRQDEFR
jgi:hypothetical protein